MESKTDGSELKLLHQCEDGCAPTTRCSSPLNRLCHSLDNTENAMRFRQSPEKYCRWFGLDANELEAVTDLDIPRLLELGTHATCLEHLTRVYHLSVNSLGAEQLGISESEFQRRLQKTD